MSLHKVTDSAREIGPLTVFQHRAALTTMQGDCTMAVRDLPSPEILRKLLDYNPETGVFTWKVRSADGAASEGYARAWNTRYSGRPAGYTGREGYTVIGVFGRILFAHRMAWAIYYGEWPKDEIDHINRCKSDNRIENLRRVGRSENSRNLPIPATNRSGVAGVYFVPARKRWRAAIRDEGTVKYLGQFKNFEDAVAVRRAAERDRGFHPNHGKVLK